jgi:hypothetical protein
MLVLPELTATNHRAEARAAAQGLVGIQNRKAQKRQRRTVCGSRSRQRSSPQAAGGNFAPTRAAGYQGLPRKLGRAFPEAAIDGA